MTVQPTPPELDAHRHRKDWRDIAERWPDQAWSSEAVLALLDALTRAEARADIRGRAVAIYQARAREAEAERDHWRECREEALDAMEHAEDTSAAIMADLRRERARIKAVQDVLDEPDAMIGTRLHVTVDRIRRALRDGSPTRECGRGPCCLGDGHAGDCRM